MLPDANRRAVIEYSVDLIKVEAGSPEEVNCVFIPSQSRRDDWCCSAAGYLPVSLIVSFYQKDTGRSSIGHMPDARSSNFFRLFIGPSLPRSRASTERLEDQSYAPARDFLAY
ncbi:unnamed protein product [Diplocarpon coronariae]